MVQMMQFLHMQGDPFHFLSNVLNSEIFSIALIPLLIEFQFDRCVLEHIFRELSLKKIYINI